MKLLLTIIGFLSVFSPLLAQNQLISGKVTDAQGLELPGVTVIAKNNLQTGTITNLDGIYSIKVPDSTQILVFSFIGMQTQSIEIGNRTVIDVTMLEETENIEEVMVVAYGKATKRSFTGSATSVSGEKLENKNTSEITKALTGEVAGVQVINGTGQPGTNAAIRIRGFGSVNSSRSPLYVIDGVPFSGDLSSLAPSDIESTTILKDATATALFGSRGANGVILITTKKGKAGDGMIEVDLKYGVNVRLLPLYNTISSPELYTELNWEGLYNQYQINPDLGEHTEMESRQWASQDLFSAYGISPYYNMWNVEGKNVVDPVTGRMNPNALRRFNPDSWNKEMFHNGIKNEANVKLSGGAEKISYFNSYGFLQDEGYYSGSDYKRFNTRLNVSHQPKEWLKGDAGLSYTYSEMNDPGQSGSANNGFNFINNMPSIYPIYERDAGGEIIKDELIGGNKYDYGFGTDRARGFSANINPAGAIKLDKSETIGHQISANSMLEATITKNFKFSTTFGAQVLANVYSSLTNMFYGDAAGIGRVSKSNSINLSYTWNQILSYNTSGNKYNLEAFIAHENTLTQNKAQSGSMSNIANPFSTELSNGIIKGGLASATNEYALESYFGQFKYDYDNKYFAHVTIRRDGTSRFPNDKWGTFGSVGFGWMMTNENFLNNISWLNKLKSKISYGILGNQALGIYPTFDSYGINNLNDEISINFSGKGNPNLTWEKSKNFNTGFEASLFNKVELEIEYFRKVTDNLLYYKQVAPSLGYASYPVNDGQILNSGIEFSILTHVIRKDDYHLNISLNGANYVNKILKMPIDDTTGDEKPIELHGGYAYAKGRSIYDFYIREWAGVDPETGEANWFAYYDEQADGEKIYITDMVQYTTKNKINKLGKEATNDYNKATQKYIDKSVVPVIAGGFAFDAGYKRLQLDMQFAYSVGGFSYDNAYAQLMSDHATGSNNWSTDILQRWRKEGDITNVPRLTGNYDKYDASTSTRFITSNSYLNLTNMKLTYNLTGKKLFNLKLTGLSIWAAGDNLFLISARKGYVPNTSESGNSSSFSYTPLSSYTMGLKVQF